MIVIVGIQFLGAVSVLVGFQAVMSMLMAMFVRVAAMLGFELAEHCLILYGHCAKEHCPYRTAPVPAAGKTSQR